MARTSALLLCPGSFLFIFTSLFGCHDLLCINFALKVGFVDDNSIGGLLVINGFPGLLLLHVRLLFFWLLWLRHPRRPAFLPLQLGLNTLKISLGMQPASPRSDSIMKLVLWLKNFDLPDFLPPNEDILAEGVEATCPSSKFPKVVNSPSLRSYSRKTNAVVKAGNVSMLFAVLTNIGTEEDLLNTIPATKVNRRPMVAIKLPWLA